MACYLLSSFDSLCGKSAVIWIKKSNDIKQMLFKMFSKVRDNVMKWNDFPCYWSFVRGNHRPPVNSPYKGQWRGALMFSLIWAWINGWVNNRDAGDLRRHRAHYGFVRPLCHCNAAGYWPQAFIFSDLYDRLRSSKNQIKKINCTLSSRQ